MRKDGVNYFMGYNTLGPSYRKYRKSQYRVVGFECLTSQIPQNYSSALEEDTNQNSNPSQNQNTNNTNSNNGQANSAAAWMKFKQGAKNILNKIREALGWATNSMQNNRKIYLTKEAAAAIDVIKKFDLQPWANNIKNILDRGDGYDNYLKGDENVKALEAIQNQPIEDSYRADNPSIARTIGSNDISRIITNANQALSIFDTMLDDIKVQRNEKAPKTLNATIAVLKRIVSLCVKIVQFSDDYDTKDVNASDQQ